jgi:hypothetical protein
MDLGGVISPDRRTAGHQKPGTSGAANTLAGPEKSGWGIASGLRFSYNPPLSYMLRGRKAEALKDDDEK